MMRVLMVWDQGINYLLARELRCLNVSVNSVSSPGFDPYGMTPTEGKREYFLGSKLRRNVGIIGDALKHDLVHVHSLDEVVPMLKRLGCRVVLHYHGSDVRNRWMEKKKYWEKADVILVSTKNLLDGAPPRAKFLPNPIDVDMFKPDPDMGLHMAALYIDYGAADLAAELAEKHDLSLIVKEKGIPYQELPYLMNRYTHYVDVKRDEGGHMLISNPSDTGSMLGLQALSCGLTVLTISGTRFGLPPEHQPRSVAAQLKMIYDEVLR